MVSGGSRARRNLALHRYDKPIAEMCSSDAAAKRAQRGGARSSAGTTPRKGAPVQFSPSSDEAETEASASAEGSLDAKITAFEDRLARLEALAVTGGERAGALLNLLQAHGPLPTGALSELAKMGHHLEGPASVTDLQPALSVTPPTRETCPVAAKKQIDGLRKEKNQAQHRHTDAYKKLEHMADEFQDQQELVAVEEKNQAEHRHTDANKKLDRMANEFLDQQKMVAECQAEVKQVTSKLSHATQVVLDPAGHKNPEEFFIGDPEAEAWADAAPDRAADSEDSSDSEGDERREALLTAEVAEAMAKLDEYIAEGIRLPAS